jgi:hypothetical protein
MWKICAWQGDHNHAINEVRDDEVSAAGLIHYRSAVSLDQDMVRTVNDWLEARQGTKAIRFHFRAKYPNKDIKPRVIRHLRTQLLSKTKRDNGIDALIEQLNSWDATGGVGIIQYSNMEISRILFQYPLIREVAKVFGVVSTVDGTHNTTKHEKATLISCCCQDSFGKLCQSGASWADGENAQSIHEILEALGLNIETLITDASKASFSVVETLNCGHILCSYHFRKHLSTAMDNLDTDMRKRIWESVMKCLRWQGYQNDAHLVHDIDETHRLYKGRNAKLDIVLDTLKKYRVQLCAYHTKQIFGFGKTSSQLSECWNSQIKGGNSYSRYLRAQGFIETLIHIATSMRIYVDETITRIRECLTAKHVVSDWIRLKLECSIRKISRCLSPEPRLHGTFDGDGGHELWLLFESVPVKGYLPAFQQKHEIKFSESGLCTCTCPFYTSTRIPCNAIATLLARKGIVSIQDISKFLNPMWLVKNHPIFPLANIPAVPASTTLSLSSIPAVTASTLSRGPVHVELAQRFNSDALRSLIVPTDVSGRRAWLTSLWEQVLPGSIACAQEARTMAEFLMRRRSALGNSLVLLVPPPLAVTNAQVQSGSGPMASVANLANASYDRRVRGRITIARSRDPSCYSVWKSAGLGQQVTCLCGVQHTNEKKVTPLYFIHFIIYSVLTQAAFAHRKTPTHKTWLTAWKNRELPVYCHPPSLRYTVNIVTRGICRRQAVTMQEMLLQFLQPTLFCRYTVTPPLSGIP